MNVAASPGNFASVPNADLPATETVVGSAAAPPPVKRKYPAPAPRPTQQGPRGIRFDFNDGFRVTVPESDRPWKVRLSDLDTGTVVFETELRVGGIRSAKRYYARFRVEVSQQGESTFVHDYSAKDREVLVQFPVGTLGDPIGWLPYAVKFKERHGCRLTCALGENLISIFRDAYPDITFLTHEEVKTERYYATYSIGLFFDDKHATSQPRDFRQVGLHRTAGYILGVDPTETKPRLFIENDSAADRRTLCLHLGPEHHPEQVLEQSRGLALDRCIPEKRLVIGWSASTRRRFMAATWSGITSRTALKMRPATSRSRSEYATSDMPRSSSACRAAYHGWHGPPTYPW